MSKQLVRICPRPDSVVFRTCELVVSSSIRPITDYIDIFYEPIISLREDMALVQWGKKKAAVQSTGIYVLPDK